MENFSVNLTVNECLICKCNTCSKSTTKIITNIDEFIPLECNYYLKILSVQPTYILVSIDNEQIHIIRKIYTSIPIKICIPNNCCTHKLNILVNSITRAST